MRADPTTSLADKEASMSSGLVDVIIAIGTERATLMESRGDALLHDDTQALEHARQLTGLPTKRSVTTSPSKQAGS